MGKNEFSWVSIDRAHEDAELADDDFDAAVVVETRDQVKLITQQAKAGAALTISMLMDDWTNRLGNAGVAEAITKAFAVGGALAAGHLVGDLIQKAIDAQAEIAALAVVEQMVAGHV